MFLVEVIDLHKIYSLCHTNSLYDESFLGIGGPFPGVKQTRGMMLTSHPHLSVEVSE
jgi:hypothetical protein